MKKIVAIMLKMQKYIILTSIFALLLGSCQNKRIYKDSFDDYADKIEKYGFGYSGTELDLAETFLPSQTFISDYSYLEGTYHYNDPGIFPKNKEAETAILTLTYDNENYVLAKDYAQKHLDLTSKNNLEYNNYYCFENMAQPKYYGDGEYSHLDEEGNNKFFPSWFTMFCFNDTKKILIFLGICIYYSSSDEEEEDKEKILSDWGYLLNTYFGQYYDFSK